MSAHRRPRFLAVLALVALAQLSACAKDALDLVPFPCADDHACPEGTLCLPSGAADAGSSCVAPQAEALCNLDADCAAVAATALCDQGRCRLSCADGTGCTTGEVCSAAKGSGVCLEACPTGACNAGLQCSSLILHGAQVCLAKGQGLGKSCTGAGSLCGPKGASLKCAESLVCTATCTAGTGCASGTVCSDGKGDGLCLTACPLPPSTCASGVCARLYYASAEACLPAGMGLDSPCTTDGARCGPEGSSSVCRGARCLAACSGGDDSNCPSGELCSAATGVGTCAKDCTADAACPADLVCSGSFADAKRWCVPQALALGSSCGGVDGTTCSLPGLGAVCQGATCVAQSCTAGVGCESVPGSFCSASTGPGACLVDCTGGALCPEGLSCRDWFDGAHKACLNPSAGVGALCTTEDASCGPTGARGLCKGQRCLLSCDPVTAPVCPSGSSCSTTSGPGVCLIDCTASGACPGDLVCEGPNSSGRRQCTPPGRGIGDPCTGTTACGMPGQGASCVQGLCALPCTAGVGCQGGSFCSSSTDSGVCLEDCSSKTCAANLVCAFTFDGARKACVPAALALDSACATDSTPCGFPGSSGVCTAGVCVPACPNGTCSFADRVCSRPALGGGGGCLTDCTNDATLCQTPGASLTCGELWHDGKSGCGARALPACAEAVPSSTCNLCGNLEQWNVDCGGGAFCGDNSTCVANNKCQCKAGFDPVNCQGLACSDANPCTYPSWWCRPQVAAQMTCTDVPVAVTGTCSCVDGRQLGVACGTGNSLTCEFLCSIGCDPTTQDCVSPTKSRCQVVPEQSEQKPECIAPAAGNLTENVPCTLSPDDCAAGLVCSDTGVLRAAPRCERYCDTNSACSISAQCLRASTSAPGYGICNPFPACTPFSSNCGGAGTCSGVARLVTQVKTTVCRPTGAGVAGALCSAGYDCGQNLLCATTSGSAGKLICTPLCNASHGCTGSLTCTSLGVPAQPGFGYCK